MMKESEPLWRGPIALFGGFVIFFFGGLWLNYLADQSEVFWLGYARTISFAFATVLIFYGIRQLRESGDDR